MREFVSCEPVEKGWSGDRKYRVTDAEGRAFLLRVMPPEKAAGRPELTRFEKEAAALGVPISEPVDREERPDGVYILYRWVNGVDAEEAVPELREAEQYALGLDAGRYARLIHSIPAPENLEDWAAHFGRKMDRKIEGYNACPVKVEGGENFLRYIEQNRGLLAGRPQTFQHGDYHIGNMMLEDGHLVVIDFDKYDFGDPWEEFNRIVWSAQAAPAFARGTLDGYFPDGVPEEFWRLLALYISSNTLSTIPWAVAYSEEEKDTALRQAADVLDWYDNMERIVPRWYSDGYTVQTVDGARFRMKERFDFSFLAKYGRVFRVFDDQDSGNICFGVERDGERFFVKFAGAATYRYDGTAADAIERLKRAVPLYKALRQDSLTEFISAEDIGGGCAAVFRWAEGEGIGLMYPSPHRRFNELSVSERTAAFESALEFLRSTAERGYLAVDFYDGSLIYDFDTRRLTVCDIDFFRPLPARNDMGRMWGSSRFMSPEEYTLGAELDEVTNVYTAGATAFALLADGDRSPEAWPLGLRTYAVAARAVSEARGERQQSLAELTKEWNAAKLYENGGKDE